ncbi:MAG: hypothetical protein QGF67_01390 [Lentisphaeria bacterium]|jgi:hypothetical protein|nr:hypothetical protein [Lentisphaeria bacterium]MDP7740065.1 hypothetical protein [Lentisphaeria bacterium]
MIEQPQIYADDLLDGLQGEPVRGASSTEDFWMFFSFAMILLVFVLMNYVSYLYSMVVNPPEQIATVDISAVADADVADIRIYVRHDSGDVYFTFADDEHARLDAVALAAGLRRRLSLVDSEKDVRVFVHAPGEILYQHVFDASFSAWQLDDATMARRLDVHLVYEETP